MAKMNGKIYLTTKQIDKLKKGRAIKIYRESKRILISVKVPDKLITMWRKQIRDLKEKITQRRIRIHEAPATKTGRGAGQE